MHVLVHNADSFDGPDGHGTFVSGTAAGSIQTSSLSSTLQSATGRYDGVAPNAKIAFMDLSTDGESIGPPDTAEEQYMPGYQAGARVHSNSWGSAQTTVYDNADVDLWLYEHPV